MTELVLSRRLGLDAMATSTLQAAARFWFLAAVTGQLIFAYYVAAFYGGAALHGRPETWNKVLPHGYIPGDTIGNFAIGMHLLFAVIVTVGGPLQLIPQVRARAPTFHHWNGRIYMLTVCATSLVGLYMLWFRGAVGDLVQHLGTSLDAVLILVFAATAVRYAIARDIATHRRWALRLFMVVSGVWFFRIGLMFWLVVNRGPVGFDPDTFQGPFLDFLSFAEYLVPLAVLEVYLRTRERAGTLGQLAMAGGLVVLTFATGVGIFGATMGMWLPHM